MHAATALRSLENPAETVGRRARSCRAQSRAGRRWRAWLGGALLAAALIPLAASADDDRRPDGDRRADGGELHRNPSGEALTLSTAGRIDRRSLFFTSLGTNGRSCGTCHQAEDGWSITPKSVRERFEADARHRSDLSPGRRRQLAARRRLDPGRAREGLQHAAQPRRDPRRHRDPADRAVRAGEGRRPLRLRLGGRAVALSPAAGVDESALPEHRDVGRPRDLQGSRRHRLPLEHRDLLRDAAFRSRRSVEHGHARARPGQHAAEHGAARGHRHLRARPVDGAGARRRRRSAQCLRRARRPLVPARPELLFRHQRHPCRRLPDACQLQSDLDDALRRLAALHPRCPARGRGGA